MYDPSRYSNRIVDGRIRIFLRFYLEVQYFLCFFFLEPYVFALGEH